MSLALREEKAVVISIITVVDIITDIMTIMIVGTYGATLDGTAYPAPFVGPSEPPWPFRSSSLRPELPASKQPGSEALRPQPPRDVMGFTRRHRKAKKSRTSPYLNKKVPLTKGSPRVPATVRTPDDGTPPPPPWDFAKRFYTIHSPKFALLRALKGLQSEVLDRREEQKRIDKFLQHQAREWARSDSYSVFVATRLAEVNTKPEKVATGTSTAPTKLGGLPKLLKVPEVIPAALDAERSAERFFVGR